MSLLYRGYGESQYPGHEKLIEKSIAFAKKVVLEYYGHMGSEYSKQVREFLDGKQGQEIGELNYALKFFKKKEYEPIEEKYVRFIDNIILSSVKLYKTHLEREKPEITLEELEDEIKTLDKLLEKYSMSKQDSDEPKPYDLYTNLYNELEVAPNIDRSLNEEN